jgi:hypothetical protein
LIPESRIDCYAWALLSYHGHFLLKTGSLPLSVFMSRLLTGYAGWFNKKYHRTDSYFRIAINLLRSFGGWTALKGFHKAGIRVKGDERILGDSDFVENVLKSAKEALEEKYELKARGYNFD